MKMKKLLAGVLSATMVATMIPASMAFSSVSAAPEDSLVASYDFTKGETEGWAKYNGLDRAEGNEAITETADGVVFTTNAYNTYSISNPLAGKVSDGGFTVTLDVSVPSTQAQNEFEGLFGFNSHGIWDWFGVTNSGLSMNMNATADPYTQRFFDLNVTAPVETTDMSDAHYVLTVDDDAITVYVNGVQVGQYIGVAGKNADDATPDVSYGQAAIALVNNAQYFDLGYWRSQGDWGAWGSMMTVGGVSFYNTALTAAEVEEDYAKSIADSLNLQVVGMQKGTTTTSQEAIRFVANVDESVVGNEAIVNLGWAWQAGTALDGSYVTPPVTTVADDDTLATEGNYAYTLLFETDTDTNYAVAPYVSVQVGGNTYNFCYNGRYGNFETTNSNSNIVYVPVDFAVVGA